MQHLELSALFHKACKNLPDNTIVNMVESGLEFQSYDFDILKQVTEQFNFASAFIYGRQDNLFTLTIKFN